MPVSCARVGKVEPCGILARVTYQHLPNGYEGVVRTWEFPKPILPRTWTQDNVEQASVLLMGCKLGKNKKFEKKTLASMREVPELRFKDFVTKEVAQANARQELRKEQSRGVGGSGGEGAGAVGNSGAGYSGAGGSGGRGSRAGRAGQSKQKRTKRVATPVSEEEDGSETSSESDTQRYTGLFDSDSEGDSEGTSSESSGGSGGSGERRHR